MQLYINTYIYSVYIFRCIYIWRSYHFKVVNLFWAMSHVISLPFLFWQSTQGHLVIYTTRLQLFNFLLMPNVFSTFLVNLWLLLPELWSKLSMTFFLLLCLLCSCSFSIIFSNYSHAANCAQIFRHSENCSSFLSTLTSTH